MTGTKLFAILLVLIVVIFVVVEVIGVGQNSVTSPPGCPGTTTDAEKFNCSPHPGLEAMNMVLAPFGPRLELATRFFPLTSTAGKQLMNVQVPADDAHSFRIAAFELSAIACGRVTYIAPDGTNSPWPKAGTTQMSQTKGSLVITKGGGKLTFVLLPPATSCEITLN